MARNVSVELGRQEDEYVDSGQLARAAQYNKEMKSAEDLYSNEACSYLFDLGLCPGHNGGALIHVQCWQIGGPTGLTSTN